MCTKPQWAWISFFWRSFSFTLTGWRISLTSSLFELQKLKIPKNGVEFCQKMIGTNKRGGHGPFGPLLLPPMPASSEPHANQYLCDHFLTKNEKRQMIKWLAASNMVVSRDLVLSVWYERRHGLLYFSWKSLKLNLKIFGVISSARLFELVYMTS